METFDIIYKIADIAIKCCGLGSVWIGYNLYKKQLTKENDLKIKREKIVRLLNQKKSFLDGKEYRFHDMNDMAGKVKLIIKRALKIEISNRDDVYVENQNDFFAKGSFLKLFSEEFDLLKDEIDILNVKEVYVFKGLNGKQLNEIKDIWPKDNSLTELWENHKNNPSFIWNNETQKIVENHKGQT